MAQDRESILRRLRALQAKTEGAGCTEAEALSAADTLSRLLDRHGFTEADLAVKEHAEIMREAFFAPDKKLGSLQFVTWALERFCDVKIWHAHRVAPDGSPSETVEFLGREPDVLVAKYLLHCFHTAMRSGWEEYQLEQGVTRVGGALKWNVGDKHRVTFERGMMSRLSDRLSTMKNERNVRVDEATGRTGMELVVVKEAEIKAAFAALKITLRAGRSSKVKLTSGSVYAAGREAANRVSIVRGIEHHGGKRAVAAISHG